VREAAAPASEEAAAPASGMGVESESSNVSTDSVKLADASSWWAPQPTASARTANSGPRGKRLESENVDGMVGLLVGGPVEPAGAVLLSH
jgi:hypothetical protein